MYTAQAAILPAAVPFKAGQPPAALAHQVLSKTPSPQPELGRLSGPLGPPGRDTVGPGPPAAGHDSPARVATSPKVVLAEGRLGEYGPGFLRAGFCLPRLVFRPKLQHGQLRGRRQNPGG